MNTNSTATDYHYRPAGRMAPQVSPPLSGAALSIGGGFEARSFRAMELEVSMDPLVMVDHYVMTEPTFGVHPHAGLSAVSLLFEDSRGDFHNRDTLGNDFDLQPGDLYWLKAGSGALHDEAPRPGSRIHGLQVFVNLPQRQRYDAPASLLVRGSDMPVIANESHRVRVALGHSNDVLGFRAPDSSMTILDGYVMGLGGFEHLLGPQRNAWVHAVEGELSVSVDSQLHTIAQGAAINIGNPSPGRPVHIRLASRENTTNHFALFDAEPTGEPFVQRGPFVMDSNEKIDEAQAAYAAGHFGRIA